MTETRSRKTKQSSSLRLLILLVVFVALLVLVLLTEKEESTGPGQEGGKFFSGIELTNIAYASLSSAGSNVFSLTREEEGWFIKQPKRYRTEPAEVAKYLQNALELKSKRLLDPDKLDLRQYGLDNPRYVLRLRDERTNRTLFFGKDFVSKMGRERIAIRYAMFSNEKKVYTLEAEAVDKLDKNVEDLRFRHVFRFDRGKITNISFDYQGQTIRFAREDEAWKMLSPTNSPITRQRLVSFLGDFYNFKVDGFIADRGNPRNYGISKNRDYLRVQGKEVGEKTLYFGRENKNRHYCVVEGDPAVYEVEKYKYERLNKDPDYFFSMPQTNRKSGAGANKNIGKSMRLPGGQN